jgi:hypothetical protein
MVKKYKLTKKFIDEVDFMTFIPIFIPMHRSSDPIELSEKQAFIFLFTVAPYILIIVSMMTILLFDPWIPFDNWFMKTFIDKPTDWAMTPRSWNEPVFFSLLRFLYILCFPGFMGGLVGAILWEILEWTRKKVRRGET